MLQNRYSEKKVSLLICPLISVSIFNSWSSILPERLFCIEFCMGILNLGKHTIEIFKKSDSLMSNLYKIKNHPFQLYGLLNCDKCVQLSDCSDNQDTERFCDSQ